LGHFFRIDELNEADAKKHHKEKARNQLESFLFDLQSKIELENYAAAATTEEKDSISTACSEVSMLICSFQLTLLEITFLLTYWYLEHINCGPSAKSPSPRSSFE